MYRDLLRKFGAFSLPDPGPEDRDYYFEFQKPRSQHADEFPPDPASDLSNHRSLRPQLCKSPLHSKVCRPIVFASRSETLTQPPKTNSTPLPQGVSFSFHQFGKKIRQNFRLRKLRHQTAAARSERLHRVRSQLLNFPGNPLSLAVPSFNPRKFIRNLAKNLRQMTGPGTDVQNGRSPQPGCCKSCRDAQFPEANGSPITATCKSAADSEPDNPSIG